MKNKEEIIFKTSIKLVWKYFYTKQNLVYLFNLELYGLQNNYFSFGIFYQTNPLDKLYKRCMFVRKLIMLFKKYFQVNLVSFFNFVVNKLNLTENKEVLK